MNLILLLIMTTSASPEPTEALVSVQQDQQDPVPPEEVGRCQDGVDDLKNSILGLESYLRDKKEYKELCPYLVWEQPSLEVYKKEPKSYLPSECKTKE